METKVIKEIAKKQNLIIATGGGAILKKENVDALKQNGKLFFLDRNLKKLKYTSSRPLSSSIDALKNSEVPKELKVKGFIIGSSVSGVAGTYVVNEKIEI